MQERSQAVKTNIQAEANRKRCVAQEKTRLIQALVDALKHSIYRDHFYSETCEACLRGTMTLKRHGYMP